METAWRATAVIRRSALARSGKAPTARVRRLISPWSRSRPLFERIRSQCAAGNAKYCVAASKPSARQATASGNCAANRSRKERSAVFAVARLAAWRTPTSSRARRFWCRRGTCARDVAHQVDGAALQPRLGQHLARREQEPGVRVGDDQLDAREAAADQLLQQPSPAGLGLLGADVHGQQPTMTVGSNPVRDEGGDVLDGACPPRIHKRRVEVQVRDRICEPLAAQRLDLVRELPGHATDGRALDALAEQRLGDRRDVARRRAADVRLGDRVVHLLLPAAVAAERLGRRTARTRPPHLHADLARRRDDPASVRPVAHVDPLTGTLVGPGPRPSAPTPRRGPAASCAGPPRDSVPRGRVGSLLASGSRAE
jgi:hypothetical protein